MGEHFVNHGQIPCVERFDQMGKYGDIIVCRHSALLPALSNAPFFSAPQALTVCQTYLRRASHVTEIEYQRGEYSISTDTEKLDVLCILEFLRTSSYWAQGRTYAVVEQSIVQSLCFGVYASA